jgi:galactokinase
MDQFAVAMGRRNRALTLNCATLAYQWVPIPVDGYQIIITNTNKRRTLADSKYNERRSECDRALSILRGVRPELEFLAELTVEEWTKVEHHLTDAVLHKRARHVVMENHRAVISADVLASGDLHTFGRMMNESHMSLRDDYEVTGAELDTLVEAAWSVDGCIGSRMTGAGFGGCTVSLVAKDRVEAFQVEVAEKYTAKTGLVPSFYVSDIGDGAREVTQEVFKAWPF